MWELGLTMVDYPIVPTVKSIENESKTGEVVSGTNCSTGKPGNPS